MKYMLLIYGAENSWTEDERKACMIESMGISDELAAQGKYLGSHRSSRSRPPRASACGTAGRSSPTARSPRRPSSSAATTCSTWPTSTRRSRSPRACRPPPRGPLRSAHSLRWMDCRPIARCRPTRRVTHPVPVALLRRRGRLGGCRARGAGRGPREAAPSPGDSRTKAGICASPLHPAATATCVRVRGGRRVITDGPFAETHEVLGGYYLILAEDRDVAIRLAAQHPGARVGTVEVRPLFDMSGIRKSS